MFTAAQVQKAYERVAIQTGDGSHTMLVTVQVTIRVNEDK